MVGTRPVSQSGCRLQWGQTTAGTHRRRRYVCSAVVPFATPSGRGVGVVVGSVCAVVGSVCAVVGSVCAVVGSVCAVVGSVSVPLSGVSVPLSGCRNRSSRRCFPPHRFSSSSSSSGASMPTMYGATISSTSDRERGASITFRKFVSPLSVRRYEAWRASTLWIPSAGTRTASFSM